MERYVGLMSGTSLDGVDAALVDFDGDALRVLATHFVPYPEDLRDESLALNSPGIDEVERIGVLGIRIAGLYAQAVEELLEGAGVRPETVAALGAHGQTVRHRPELGFSVQVLNAAALVERTGIRTVADFRARDLAAGGQGAPLVPAFHAACLAAPGRHRAIVNLGGMSNVTDLAPGKPPHGFDTGPGNVLIDLWARQHLGVGYDNAGAWAASGTVIEPVLDAMLADPYFAAPPPKSTGRERFNRAWLESFALDAHAPRDVQATLTALTAASIARAIQRWCGAPEEVLVCGGGARNARLLSLLATELRGTRLATTAQAGVDPDWVEAIAFAWLARQALRGAPGNVPSVTGAAGPRILGAIHPA